MTVFYTIEEQNTTGWHKLTQEYRHLTKQECTDKYNDLLKDGVNPNDLRVVRDDL